MTPPQTANRPRTLLKPLTVSCSALTLTRLTGCTEYETSKMEDSELGAFAYDFTVLRDDVRKVEEEERKASDEEVDGLRPLKHDRPLRELECVLIDLSIRLTDIEPPIGHSDMTGHGQTYQQDSTSEISCCRVDVPRRPVVGFKQLLLLSSETRLVEDAGAHLYASVGVRIGSVSVSVWPDLQA
jgi:hypothetical protein